jgi:glycosyltransferase involved in cell wall biosynthesis
MRAPVLSIIVPVKDEEEAIGPFVERVGSVIRSLSDPAAKSFEILFVDDGSSDDTLNRIKRAHEADDRVRAISFSRNFGKEAA